MTGTGEGEGSGAAKLENQIAVVKYSLLFSNIIIWMLAAAVFALCLWMRFEIGFQEWIEKLALEDFYIGVYVLIAGSVIVMFISFIGCIAALMENTFALLVFIVTQVVGFICGLSGSAVLLDHSTYDSKIQPQIRESMRRLIMNSHHQLSKETLAMVQENIGCCGADGPNDYLNLRQPLPTECRDTVTGNAFFHGCVDELTWFFEEKAGWVCGLAMTICFIHVMNIVLSIILTQAVKKEEQSVDPYRR